MKIQNVAGSLLVVAVLGAFAIVALASSNTKPNDNGFDTRFWKCSKVLMPENRCLQYSAITINENRRK